MYNPLTGEKITLNIDHVPGRFMQIIGGAACSVGIAETVVGVWSHDVGVVVQGLASVAFGSVSLAGGGEMISRSDQNEAYYNSLLDEQQSEQF
jgi:hypothetical protein